jgi:hypothetical protein
MFTQAKMERAVDLQARSYALFQWLASGVGRGVISFKVAHKVPSVPAAAQEWVKRNYQNIPQTARPLEEDLSDFSSLFATYLQNSFELVKDPGTRLYSPDAHCFCPCCSWLIDASNLKTRTPEKADKKRAERMMADALIYLASEHNTWFSEEAAKAIVEEKAARQAAAIFTYGLDLLRRIKGTAVGPASLVLWRTFAWKDLKSPKKNFQLSAELFLQAQADLAQRILQTKKS